MIDDASFDPSIPPRPCTIPNCKNHVPGNSIYRRCKVHRKETRNYYNTAQGRRDKQKAVFKKAKEDGRDPVEALREFLRSTHYFRSDDENSDNDEEGRSGPIAKKRKRRQQLRDVSAVVNDGEQMASGGPSQMAVEVIKLTTCVGKNCANLLNLQVIACLLFADST